MYMQIFFLVILPVALTPVSGLTLYFSKMITDTLVRLFAVRAIQLKRESTLKIDLHTRFSLYLVLSDSSVSQLILSF